MGRNLSDCGSPACWQGSFIRFKCYSIPSGCIGIYDEICSPRCENDPTFFFVTPLFSNLVFFSLLRSHLPPQALTTKRVQKSRGQKRAEIFFFLCPQKFWPSLSLIFVRSYEFQWITIMLPVRTRNFFSSLNSCAPSGVIFVIFVFLNSNCCESTGFLIKDQTVFRREILFAGQFSSV